MIPAKVRAMLENQQYRIAGSHSAVKVCSWTKRALLNQGSCYKQRFYGVESHRCMQMTPWLGCPNMCMYCWRVMERVMVRGRRIDEPGRIIDSCVSSHRALLTGFKGNEMVDKGKWREAQRPNQAAISLAGEPTLYPRISDLISEFKRRRFTAFLVTNGLLPERLEGMEEPTNLYISLDAPDKRTYTRIDRPSMHDSWERLNKSLQLMPSFSCTKVLRLTMVKGWNMVNPRGYARLIKAAGPDFIEVKAYMHVGESRRRLAESNMPGHHEIDAFAGKISDMTGYVKRDEQPESRVVLLSQDGPRCSSR